MSGDVAGMVAVGACTLAGFAAGALIPGFWRRPGPGESPRAASHQARDAAVIDAVVEFAAVFDEIATLADRVSTAKADYRGSATAAANIDQLKERLATSLTRVQVLCQSHTLPAARRAAELAGSVLAAIASRRGEAHTAEPAIAAIREYRSTLFEALRAELGRASAPDADAPSATAGTAGTSA